MAEQPTAPGYYWANIYGHWQPVELMPLGVVMAIGWASECDAVTEWGPRIDLPSAGVTPPTSSKLDVWP